MSECDIVLILNGSTPSIKTQLENQNLDILKVYKYEQYEYERIRISDWYIGGRINKAEKDELVKSLEKRIKGKVIKKINKVEMI